MNSPSQEFSRDELKKLAIESGMMAFEKTDALVVDDMSQLAKFAQLLLQREGAGTDKVCSRCLGSGEQEYLSDSSPDAYEVMGNCSECGGTGEAQQPTAPGGEDLEAALCFVYGMLWHVNSGLHTPAELGVTSISPELAARETRKYLLQTFPDKIKRGSGINKAQEFIAALAKKEPQ